jgi:endonuclease/exonuclease/phosphatase family metal-dependent hydrolase
MKKFFALTLIIFTSISIQAQNFEDLEFGSDSTFEVITWNIEWFPKEGVTTVNYVSNILEALDADLYALQEISDTILFKQMLDSLEDYTGYFQSSWFAGLAYIYKTDEVTINDIYEIYTTSEYWRPFPRSPMVIELSIGDDDFIVINNHFKCCGDGILDIADPSDEETRRLDASNLLKEYIDENFTNNKVVILGDLNDNLADSPENNIFQVILNDSLNYDFVDLEIAYGSSTNWSYPTWPSHLDHVCITNELFQDFEEDGSVVWTIKLEDYFEGGWWEYETYVSDHRPVALKVFRNPISGVNDNLTPNVKFVNYPNPFITSTTIEYELQQPEKVTLTIYDHLGKQVHQVQVNQAQGSRQIKWNAEGYADGIYYYRLQAGEQVANGKMLKVR